MAFWILSNSKLFISGLYNGVVLIVIVFVFSLLLRIGGRKRYKLPPKSSKSWYHNYKMRVDPDGLARPRDTLEQSLVISRENPEQFPLGSYFISAQPLTWKTFIFITDYKLARLVLLGDSKVGIKEGVKANIFHSFNFLDRNVSNIFTARSADNEREKARKYIAPAFSTINLNNTIPYINENITWAFGELDAHITSDELCDMKDLLLKLFLKTVSMSSFGVEFCPFGEKKGAVDGKKYLEEEEIAIKERFLQVIMPWRRYMFWDGKVKRCQDACVHLRNACEQTVQLYKEKMKDVVPSYGTGEEESHHGGGGGGSLMMSRLMSHSYPSELHRLSDLQAMILAGHETSAYTFSFFLLHMSQHPEARKKLQLELDSVITAESCEGGRPSWSQVSKCEYLSWCLKESMRLLPVAAPGSARTLEEDIEYMGTTLPKGHIVVTAFYAMFRQPWINRAEEFIPERWSDDNPQVSQLKDMLMPFSLGKRSCIGKNMANLQLKMFAANFMKYYEFEIPKDKTVEFEFALTLKPKCLSMHVTKR